jgi:hypothetical protein
MMGACCVGVWMGAARFSINARTEIIIAVLAITTADSHITILAFASDTSPFVASVGKIVSIRVSSFIRRASISSLPDGG